jgi:ferredoxin-thioredoxin reductase catalytic subunit
MNAKDADWEKTWNSVFKTVTKYAERGPFFLNPDEVVVRNIVSGLAKNKMDYGYAYCPCRQVQGSPEKDKENICPCRMHKEDIARQGICECGLFVSHAYLNERRK